MKLLLVDANEAFAHHLRGELLRSGAMLCDLEFATSLADATRQLGSEPFDAILIDPQSLADASDSIYGELQGLAPRTPLLVLSDADDDSAAVAAVRLGAHDYLTKSHTQPEWLLRRVRYAMDRQRGAVARAKLAGPHLGHRQQARVPQLARTGGASSTLVGSDTKGGLPHVEDPPHAENLPHAGDTAATVDHGQERGSQASTVGETTTTDCWHVLHIEGDPVFATLSDKLLRCESPHPLEVTHVRHVREATEKLQAAAYDAVLLDLDESDSLAVTSEAELEPLQTVLQHAGQTPVLVIATTGDAATAIDGMRSGAEDFLGKCEPDTRYLRRAIQLAIVRRDRALRLPPPPAIEKTSQPACPAADTVDRRRHSRYLLTKPIFATPVLPDGSPAATYSADGFSVDVSEGGLRFEIGNLDRLPTTHLLVGIEGVDTVLYFATVEARHVVQKGGSLEVGAQFAKGPRDLISKRES